MTFVSQSIWGWPIALYLYLGGLGGGGAALAYFSALKVGRTSPLGHKIEQFGMTAGFFILAVGTVLLVFDLADPWHIMYILMNPRSWIFWGVLVISLFLIFCALYIGTSWLSESYQPRWANALRARLGTFAAGAAVTGILVALYTGFLVSMAPAIGFWDTPTLPLLFLVSALSTGSALLLLAFSGSRQEGMDALRHFWEQLDMALVGLEILILLAFFNYFRVSAESARLSRSYLLGSPGFLGGFVGLGLLVPWIIEIVSWRRTSRHVSLAASGTVAVDGTTRDGQVGIAAAAVLILLGGFLLRFYILRAGVFGYPFPRL